MSSPSLWAGVGRSTRANFTMFLSPSSFYTASLPAAHLSVDESCSRIKTFAGGFGIECPFESGPVFYFQSREMTVDARLGSTVHSHLLGCWLVSLVDASVTAKGRAL